NLILSCYYGRRKNPDISNAWDYYLSFFDKFQKMITPYVKKEKDRLFFFPAAIRSIYNKSHYVLLTLLAALFLAGPFVADNSLMYEAQYSKFFFFINICKLLGIFLLIRLASIKEISLSLIDIIVLLFFLL